MHVACPNPTPCCDLAKRSPNCNFGLSTQWSGSISQSVPNRFQIRSKSDPSRLQIGSKSVLNWHQAQNRFQIGLASIRNRFQVGSTSVRHRFEIGFKLVRRTSHATQFRHVGILAGRFIDLTLLLCTADLANFTGTYHHQRLGTEFDKHALPHAQDHPDLCLEPSVPRLSNLGGQKAIEESDPSKWTSFAACLAIPLACYSIGFKPPARTRKKRKI